MRRLTQWIACAALFLAAQFASAQFAGAAADTVGDFGDVDRIRFEGNETYESSGIRLALSFDLGLLIAGHPEAPLPQFLALLQKRVTDGYLHMGFAAPDVNARFDETQSAVVVTVSEGPRYRKGRIAVTGAKTISVEKLSEGLTALQFEPPPGFVPKAAAGPQIKTKKPFWNAGDHASFAPGDWLADQKSFQKVFQSMGYFDATFTVSQRPEEDGAATLLVAITDEGPQALLGEIEVHGAQKNSVEDIIQFLNLPKGTLLDCDLKARVEKKLSESARFLKHTVEILTPPFGNDASILRVTLTEYEAAPPLNQPLSNEEQVMLRMAHWLNNLKETDSDLEFRWFSTKAGVTTNVHAVVSHRDSACLVRLSTSAGEEAKPFEVAIHMKPEFVTLDSPLHALRYEAKSLIHCIIGTLKWSAHPPDAMGHMSDLNFGLGIKGSDEPLPPFILQIDISPVAVLRELHKYGENTTIKDGVLTIEHPDHRTRIEVETGRLLHFEGADESGSSMTVNAVPGRYRELLEEHQRETSNHRVIVSGDLPVSNLLSFLATCLPDMAKAQAAPAAKSRMELAQALLKRGAFHAFDRLLLDFVNGRGDGFELPADPNAPKEPFPMNYLAFVLPITRALVPNPSWPWTASREFVFAISRQSNRAVESIQTMLGDTTTGPVANFSSACLFGLVSPELKKAFARIALDRLRLPRFYADYEPFLNDNSAIGKLFLAAAETLQDLDDSEIDSLVQQIPLDDQDRRSLARTLSVFPAHRNDPARVALQAAFDEAWEPLIEPRLRAVLEAMAN